MTTTTIKALHTEAIKALFNKEDGTYDLSTLVPVSFDHGYQVSFCNIGDNYTDDDYEFIATMFAEVSADGKTYAGKFEGTAEVSFYFTDKLTAIKYAKMFNQISIWDWKNSDEIKTGGTGKRA